MPRVPLAVALTALVVTGLLAGCTEPEPTPTPTATMPAPSGDGVLRIGTLFSTTGADATDAETQTAAVNAAVREIGMAGVGVPVEVVTRNGGTAGDGLAEAAVADLVARGVDAIIGPSSAEVAALVAPLTVSAGIPLISASAAGERPAASSPGYWRVIPSVTVQAAALAAALDATSVALLRADDAAGSAWAAALQPATDVVLGDPAADAATIADADPDAVVVATADAGETTSAALAALLAAGVPADTIWIAGRSLGSYPAVGAALEGAHAVSSGYSTDAGFLARVRLEDPGLPGSRFAAQAYDAVMLVALAAALAGDDGAASIAATLPAVPDAGIPCTSYGACMDVLTTQTDIAYAGVSGPFRFDEAGDRVGATYLRYDYDATGSLVLAEGPL